MFLIVILLESANLYKNQFFRGTKGHFLKLLKPKVLKFDAKRWISIIFMYFSPIFVQEFFQLADQKPHFLVQKGQTGA